MIFPNPLLLQNVILSPFQMPSRPGSTFWGRSAGSHAPGEVIQLTARRSRVFPAVYAAVQMAD